MQYHDITTAEQLRHYCRKLAHAKSIAFDTEFVSEHTYRPVLCLIQVAADGDLAVIDPLTVGDVTPFWEAIAAPGHETIVHAGRGEVEFCLLAIGRPPAQLFDVQLAAGLAGAEYPAGLGTLIAKFLGRSSSKHETRTDWQCRPLSKRQIEYALDDASCLQPLRDTIRATLSNWGRLAWIEEDMAAWLENLERSISHERWRASPATRGSTPADWPLSASCSTGAKPRPNAAISRRGASSRRPDRRVSPPRFGRSRPHPGGARHGTRRSAPPGA